MRKYANEDYVKKFKGGLGKKKNNQEEKKDNSGKEEENEKKDNMDK